MTTVSTVGYGDISPKSYRARSITMALQAFVTLGALTTVSSMLGAYVSKATS